MVMVGAETGGKRRVDEGEDISNNFLINGLVLTNEFDLFSIAMQLVIRIVMRDRFKGYNHC